MTVNRVVPNLYCAEPEATRNFYTALVGLEVVMDLGWISTLASPTNRTAQINVTGSAENMETVPQLTIGVSDVDAVHEVALTSGVEIVLSLRDEEWGVRRFWVRDPDGRIVNVVGSPRS